MYKARAGAGSSRGRTFAQPPPFPGPRRNQAIHQADMKTTLAESCPSGLCCPRLTRIWRHPMVLANRFLALAGMVAALGTSAALAQSGKLVLYTSQPNADAQQTVDAFKAKYPGVEVEWVRDGTTKVMAKLEAEFVAGNPAARRAPDRRHGDHGGAEAGRPADALSPEADVARYDAGALRQGQGLFLHQADHHRHRLQHRRADAAHVLEGSRQAGGQGPGDDAEPADLGRRARAPRRADAEPRPRLGLLSRRWPRAARRPRAATAASSNRSPAARRCTASSSTTCRSARAPRARR